MKIQNISFDKIRQFSKRDVDYQLNPKLFSEFISYQPSLEGLIKATSDRALYPVNRTLLTGVLAEQYAGLVMSETQKMHVEKLSDERTFTITCAHQPSLFTGPAYYIYKILSVVRLADQMNKTMKGHHFVPVFINGSEDHDFKEVNHTTIFNKKIQWDDTQKGPVGRFKIDTLQEVMDQFTEILGSGAKSSEIKEILYTAYRQSNNYNDFTLRFLHALTKDIGLIILIMDNKLLKQAFVPVMRKELSEQTSENKILETQSALQNLGYKPQAFPRQINLFYFTEAGFRERIVHEDDQYFVQNTDIVWSLNEILDHLENCPERFSPNVITRPLYQETILPDIAFIGGGGEIAYWMERKSQFSTCNVFFPCLIRRNSVIIIPKSVQKNLDKTGLAFESFLQEENKIIHEFLLTLDHNPEFVENEKSLILSSFDRLKEHAGLFDHTLIAFMEAEKTKISKILEHANQKLLRVLKQQQEVKIQQIKSVKEKLFPGNGLQERVDNFLQFYISQEGDLLKELLPVMNPLEKDCKVLFL
jgi:bacillithiol biosynthesis cysteine-adding enzyme BshC